MSEAPGRALSSVLVARLSAAAASDGAAGVTVSGPDRMWSLATVESL